MLRWSMHLRSPTQHDIIMKFYKILENIKNITDDEILRFIELNTDINTHNDYKRVALLASAEGGYDNIIKILIKAKVNLNLQDDCGHTALMLAAYRRHYNVAKMLIDAGADISLRNIDGLDALQFSRFGGLKMLMLLIDAGANH